MRKKILITVLAGIGLIFYACKFREFTKGVIDDANRMDTTKIPQVYNIDSINNALDTVKKKNSIH